MHSFEQIFLDMDGVLTDFVGAVLSLQGQKDLLSTWPSGERNIHSVLGISKSEFWRIVENQGADFWANLPEFEWSKNLVDLVRQFAPMTILTSPSLSPSCFEGKVRWLYENFPKVNGKRFSDFLIGRPKELLAGPRRVLIDDSEANVAAFQIAGGEAILFPQPWNANFAIRDRLGYVQAQLGLLAEKYSGDEYARHNFSLLSRALIGEPFQLKEFIHAGAESVVFGLENGNILKITSHILLPDSNPLSLPTLDHGYVELDGHSFLWFIQPAARTPIEHHDFMLFLKTLRYESLRMTDPSLNNLGYYEGEIRILDPWSVVPFPKEL